MFSRGEIDQAPFLQSVSDFFLQPSKAIGTA
jgi:hypothetical protein